MTRRKLSKKELEARVLGGKARAKRLTKAERSASARKAGLAKGRKYRRLLALEKKVNEEKKRA